MHLTGGTGQHDQNLAVFFQVETRGRAVGVGENFRRRRAVTLPVVTLGHGPFQKSESFTDGIFDFGVVNHFLSQYFSNGFAGDVIAGWAEASSGDHEIRSFPAIRKKSFISSA